MFGTAQYAVFQDMGHPCAVRGGSPKSNVEDLIIIVIFQHHDSGAAFFVFQQISSGMDIGNFLLHEQLICRYIFQSHSHSS